MAPHLPTRGAARPPKPLRQRTTLATLTVKIVATARTLSPAATRSVTVPKGPMNRAWSSFPASARPAA